ncbi:TonB-dependent receptor [Sinomicrobium pectinilyticum]|nr:TonB-dependent receptor [Sinomicrobium pectinilyticum]
MALEVFSPDSCQGGGQSLKAFMEILIEETDYNFLFDASQLEKATLKKDIIIKGRPIRDILQDINRQVPIEYSIENNDVSIRLVPQVQVQRQRTGRLNGHVYDDLNMPLLGANIVIEGKGLGVSTGFEGDYSIQLLPGIYTIQVSYISFTTQRITDVVVEAGKTTTLNVVLKPLENELEEVVVTATYQRASIEGLYARQKNSASVIDGISSEQIARTPDNNVAQVLKRISGVTVDKDKYVTVRGMSERYNNVQLNGASMPSTEPNRRNFAFDVVPATLIDNVTIAKSFTPDMPGEFVGGLVEVNTLSVPDEHFLTITAGTGMNTNSTGQDFYSNNRYASDWVFGNISDRKWYSGRTPEAALENIENAGQINNYGLRKYTADPVQSYEVSGGKPFDLGNDNRFGVVAAITYRNEQTIEDIKEIHTISRDSLYKDGSFRNKFVTAVGTVANLGWEMPGHKVNWRNLYNSRFTHTNQQRYMNKYYEGYNFAEQYSAPLIANLWQTQLDGEHFLIDQHLQLNWNASYNKVIRTSPDDRLISGRVLGSAVDGEDVYNWVDGFLLQSSGNPQNIRDGHVMYSKLEETKKNAGIDVAYSFDVGNNRQKLKAGYLGTFRDADFGQQYLRGKFLVDPLDYYGLSPQEMFAPRHFTDGSLTYVVSGMQGVRPDYYTGKQEVQAAYLLGEFALLQKLHIMAGIRLEDAKTEVNTKLYSLEEGVVDSLATVNKTDWLPAATLVYKVTGNLNARLAYGRTLARPDFRELSYNTYYNVDDRVMVINRGLLKQSLTDNYDLRLEWFPRPDEVISVSAFYKKFTNPIELVTHPTSDQQNFYMYSVNLDEATVKGLEFNLRKSFGFIAPGTLLEALYLSGNASLIEGDVTYNLGNLLELPEGSRPDRDRPLQGLSPYMVNAGLGYEGQVFGIAVNYGREGRKLVTSGDYEKHDQYLDPRDILDLQLSARFLQQKMEVKFNISDLFNQDFIIYRNSDYDPTNDQSVDPGTYHDRTGLGMDYNKGDWVMSRVKKGTNLSLSVSYKF